MSFLQKLAKHFQRPNGTYDLLKIVTAMGEGVAIIIIIVFILEAIKK